jgi:ParB family transcriptional regulator, chromosome partitioning protein
MKRKALGKGLSALLPEPEAPAAGEGGFEIPVGLIDPNPFQPRALIRPQQLETLAASIRESGIVQPILVRRVGDRYQVIAGERRLRAAQQLGLERVPVSVREVPDDRLLELALVENIQRENLNPIEEALAFQRLQGEFALGHEEIARRVGRDRTTIVNTLRLLRLPAEVRGLIVDGRIDAGHARPLLALEQADEQVALAHEVATLGLSTREVERRVAARRAKGGGAPREQRRKDANTRAAEERLRAALGARVEIARAGKGGSLRIRFSSEAELNRLYELLLRAGRGRAH